MVRYKPGPAFEEVKEEPMLDISPTDSTKFWLIQWPKDQLDVSDFHGKEFSLQLHKDGNLGNLESSSGKSYELVSYKAQQPDATIFQPSGSEIKPVGKISRRVCLVRYPEPEELVKPNFGGLTPSSKISAGSSRKTKSRFTSASKNRSSQGSARSIHWANGAQSRLPNTSRRERMKAAWGTQTCMSGKASQGSQAHAVQSNTTSEVPQSSSEKSKKKKVKIVE